VTYTLTLALPSQDGHEAGQLAVTVSGELVVESDYRESYSGPQQWQVGRLSVERALAQLEHADAHPLSHALAFCGGLELLSGIVAPERAQVLRAAAAELERLTAHLNTLVGLLGALGMGDTERALADLRAQAAQSLAQIAPPGSWCTPGGVRRDLADADRQGLLLALQKVNRSLFRIAGALIDGRSVTGRTADVGVLARAAAEAFAVRGPIARASGISQDARAEAASVYVQLGHRVVTQEGGDVHSRMVVLLLECLESLAMAERALADLPDGPVAAAFPLDLPDGEVTVAVEAPTGTLRYTMSSVRGRLADIVVDAPPPPDRLLVRALLVGARVDDVPLIIRSLDARTRPAS
jgi:Ni,Fe-hydrogenase III large subunit